MFEKEKREAAIEVCRRVGFGPKEIPYWYDTFHPKVENAVKELIRTGNVFPPSFILTGPVGTGKSAMLSAAFKDWVMMVAEGSESTAGCLISGIARHCLFLTYNDFIDIVMAELDNKDDAGGMTTGELKRIPFVIIDDLLNGSASPYQLGKLEDFISCRYNAGYPTWFSANFDMHYLKGLPGFERSYSRLADKRWCRYFQLTGSDRRKMKVPSGQPPAGEGEK
jgi:DNA replication protein DnaC